MCDPRTDLQSDLKNNVFPHHTLPSLFLFSLMEPWPDTSVCLSRLSHCIYASFMSSGKLYSIRLVDWRNKSPVPSYSWVPHLRHNWNRTKGAPGPGNLKLVHLRALLLHSLKLTMKFWQQGGC